MKEVASGLLKYLKTATVSFLTTSNLLFPHVCFKIQDPQKSYGLRWYQV